MPSKKRSDYRRLGYSTDMLILDRKEDYEIPSSAEAPLFPGEDIQEGYKRFGFSQYACFSREIRPFWPDFPVSSGHSIEIQITPDGVLRAREAVQSYRERYPQAVPRYGYTFQDCTLARLEWLSWWTDHALRNFENPIILIFFACWK